MPSYRTHFVGLHAVALLRLRPTLFNQQTSLELIARRPPNITHLRVFGYLVWVPVPEPQRKTIEHHIQNFGKIP